MVALYFKKIMYERTEVLTEEEFAWQFDSPEHLGEYLLEQYYEDIPLRKTLVLKDLKTIKQAFLNQRLDFYHMECIKFEELYLTDD